MFAEHSTVRHGVWRSQSHVQRAHGAAKAKPSDIPANAMNIAANICDGFGIVVEVCSIG